MKEIVIREVVRERAQVLRTLIVVRKRILDLRIPVAVRQVVVRAQTVKAVLPVVQADLIAVPPTGIMVVQIGVVAAPTGTAVPATGAAVPAAVPVKGTYPADQQKEAHLQKVREAAATEALLPVLQKEEAAQEDKTYSFINKLLLLSGRRTGLRRFAD